MKYDFYDDMSMFNNFMPYTDQEFSKTSSSFQSSVAKMNESSNNMPSNNFNYEIIDDFNNNQNKLSQNTNNLNLYSPYEGYMRGNGFRDQYVPYKNYQPQRLNITSEKDEMLVNIGQYSFMAHEMNLYLDTHPNDREALNKFQEFRDKANELIKNYERKYGPLSLSGNVSSQTPFNWVTTEWPWER